MTDTKRITLHLNDEAIDLIDFGTMINHGRSQRVVGLLKRFEALFDSAYAVTNEKLLKLFCGGSIGDISDLMEQATLSFGRPGPWLKDAIDNKVLHSELHEYIRDANDADIFVIEEVMARDFGLGGTDVDIECNPEEIKQLRINKGMSQEKAAEFAGVSRKTWQNWESGATTMPSETWNMVSKEFYHIEYREETKALIARYDAAVAECRASKRQAWTPQPDGLIAITWPEPAQEA